jgi:hypothetical protein
MNKYARVQLERKKKSLGVSLKGLVAKTNCKPPVVK